MSVRSLDRVEVLRDGVLSPATKVSLSHRLLTDSAATCRVEWSLLASVTRRARHPWAADWGRSSGVPAEVRAAADGGPLQRLFVGMVEGSAADLGDGSSSSDLVDRITRLQRRVSIPPVAFTMPPHTSSADYQRRRVGMWGSWVTHHVAQRAGFHATHALQTSAVWFQSMAGSAWLASDPDHAVATLGELTQCYRLSNSGTSPGVWQGTNTPCMQDVYALGMTRTRRRSTVDAWQLTVDMASDAPTSLHTGRVDLRTTPVSLGAGIRLDWTQTLIRVYRLDTDGSTVLLGQAARAIDGVYTMRWSVVARPGGEVALMGSGGRGVVATWTSTGVALRSGASARGTVRVQSEGPISAVSVCRSDSDFLVRQGVSARIIRNTFSQRSLPSIPYVEPRDALSLLKEQAVAEDQLLWVDRTGVLNSISREVLEARPQVATISDTTGGIDLNALAAQVDTVGPYRRVVVRSLFTRAIIRNDPVVHLAVGQQESMTSGDDMTLLMHPEEGEGWLQDSVDTQVILAGHPYPPPRNREFDRAYGSVDGGMVTDANGNSAGWLGVGHVHGWSLSAADSSLVGSMRQVDHRTVLREGILTTAYASSMPAQGSTGLPEQRKQQPLPQLRGMGKVLKEDVATEVVVTGSEDHGEYEHDGGFYLQNSNYRGYMAQRLAERALNPQPTVTVRTSLDLGLQVGDRVAVQVRSTARLDLDCLVVGVSMDLPGAEMSLDVLVLSGHDLGWDELDPLPPPFHIPAPEPLDPPDTRPIDPEPPGPPDPT